MPVPDKKEAMSMLEGGNEKKPDKPSNDMQVLVRQVEGYFRGERKNFCCKMDLSGSTPFQYRVWKATREIPYGQVRSYKWVAEKAGSPLACRAVGNALAANPLPLIIPCHRVICSDGKPGGFGGRAGNIEAKLMLLELEGRRLESPTA